MIRGAGCRALVVILTVNIILQAIGERPVGARPWHRGDRPSRTDSAAHRAPGFLGLAWALIAAISASLALRMCRATNAPASLARRAR